MLADVLCDTEVGLGLDALLDDQGSAQHHHSPAQYSTVFSWARVLQSLHQLPVTVSAHIQGSHHSCLRVPLSTLRSALVDSAHAYSNNRVFGQVERTSDNRLSIKQLV